MHHGCALQAGDDPFMVQVPQQLMLPVPPSGMADTPSERDSVLASARVLSMIHALNGRVDALDQRMHPPLQAPPMPCAQPLSLPDQPSRQQPASGSTGAQSCARAPMEKPAGPAEQAPALPVSASPRTGKRKAGDTSRGELQANRLVQSQPTSEAHTDRQPCASSSQQPDPVVHQGGPAHHALPAGAGSSSAHQSPVHQPGQPAHAGKRSHKRSRLARQSGPFLSAYWTS